MRSEPDRPAHEDACLRAPRATPGDAGGREAERREDSLYWKRANKYGAIASVLTVAALWIAFLPEVLRKGEVLIFEIDIMPVTLIFAASTLALIAVTLLTPPPDKELVQKFFPEGVS